MPAQHGIVGPIPEGREPEEYDKLRRRVLWKMPAGLFAIGSRAGDRRNMMTANWVTQVSFDPKLVAVSVEKAALTHELVHGGRAFSVNVVDREDRAVVRKFTKPVTVDEQAHTLNEIPYRDGRTGVPVLSEAVAFV